MLNAKPANRRHKKQTPAITTNPQLEDDESDEEEHSTWGTNQRYKKRSSRNSDSSKPGMNKDKPLHYTIRRASRQKPKPDFYGNNIMVGSLKTPKEESAEQEDKKKQEE